MRRRDIQEEEMGQYSMTPIFTFPIDFFTSDTHFSHVRISEMANRGFDNTNDTIHMDETMIQRWNETVGADDIVLHLGDVALGQFDKSIQLVKRLNGIKFLIPGNHDRVSSAQSLAHRQRFRQQYMDVFEDILPEIVEIDIDGQRVVASHYPYAGDSGDHEKDRYTALRPANNGLPLLHGHTHSHLSVDPVRYPRQYNVGVDAHDMRPVPMSVIREWIGTL